MRVINVLNEKKKIIKRCTRLFSDNDIDPRMFFDFNVLAKTRRNHIILR